MDNTYFIREAAKKVPPPVVRPLRGGRGVKDGPLRKKNFFEALKSSDDH